MSNRVNPIKPRPWSAKGRAYLDKAGCAGLAGDLQCSRQLPSRWSLGRVATPVARVEHIITLAMQEGVCLTPADLGRPDLAKTKGAKA